MKPHFFLLLMAVLFMVGCQRLTNLCPAEYEIEKLNEEEFMKLNGVYSNHEDTVFGELSRAPIPRNGSSSENLTHGLYRPVAWKIEGAISSISLEFVSSKRAIIKGYGPTGTLFYTGKLKGKFKNGYFYLRPKIVVIPFFPILYIHRFERARISIANNYLVIDHTINRSGFALMGGGSDRGRITSVYPILNNE
jgi:hypothetical protein